LARKIWYAKIMFLYIRQIEFKQFSLDGEIANKEIIQQIENEIEILDQF